MLSDEIKMLEDKVERLEKSLKESNWELGITKHKLNKAEACLKSQLPVKIYIHKGRRNTTLKFEDGHSITVKRKANEKDCTETAIAYALLKNALTKNYLKKLIKEAEIHE